MVWIIFILFIIQYCLLFCLWFVLLVKPATTTLSSRKSCMEESTLIHWNLSWVACLVIPLASCFNFAQAMASWESISGLRGIDERDHNCECGQLETVEHVLKECPLHPAERDLLRKVSPELDSKILLDTKKGLGAVVKFLDSLPQLLCWWFAWLSSLLRFYWVSISGIELLGVMYLRFPLAHGYFHGKFGAIERLNLLRALTPLLCQSHRDKCFWNFMSSLYVVLFCNSVCNYLM